MLSALFLALLLPSPIAVCLQAFQPSLISLYPSPSYRIAIVRVWWPMSHTFVIKGALSSVYRAFQPPTLALWFLVFQFVMAKALTAFEDWLENRRSLGEATSTCYPIDPWHSVERENSHIYSACLPCPSLLLFMFLSNTSPLVLASSHHTLITLSSLASFHLLFSRFVPKKCRQKSDGDKWIASSYAI